MSAAGGIFAAAREVQEKLSHAGFRFCFIGGLALQRWGEPRYTQDVDLSRSRASNSSGAASIGRRTSISAALDLGLVERELAPLLRIKEDATSLDRLRAIRSRY